MTRLTTAATRLLTACHTARLRPAGHHRLRPAQFTYLVLLRAQRCPSTASSHFVTRPFSTAPSPSPIPSLPSTDAAAASSTPAANDTALSATARLISPSSPSPAPSPTATILYTSPFTTAVRRMKLFSLSSCGLSLLSSPLLLLLASPAIPLAGRLAMCAAVSGFGLGTTLALTKFTEPYVIRAVLGEGDAAGSVVFETMNVWARPRYRSVPVEGLRPLHNRLLSNVRALHSPPAERPYSDYFLHADIVEHPLLRPLIEHSLPLPEATSEEKQPAEATSVEQQTTAHQPAADSAPKQR